jgi:DNA-binding MarR family transcriptional regulator
VISSLTHMGSQASDGDQALRETLDAVRLLVRKLRLAASATEKRSGLSMAQLFVLQRLAEAGSLSLGELADRTLTDQSSVSVVVKRLAEAGLVSRKKSSEDNRRLHLSITARGRARLKGAPRAGQEALIDGLRSLGGRELGRLASLLSRVIAAMGIDGLTPHLMFDDDRPSGRSRFASRS